MKNNNINIKNSRTNAQREVMERIQKDGVCPFCRENFETYHTKPIIFETDHWIVTENAWPYKNTKKHILFVAKKHITSPAQLEKVDWEDLHVCIARLENEHNLTHGAFLIRFGDSKHTGATVDHLHAHIIVAESSDVPIKTRVG